MATLVRPCCLATATVLQVRQGEEPTLGLASTTLLAGRMFPGHMTALGEHVVFAQGGIHPDSADRVVPQTS